MANSQGCSLAGGIRGPSNTATLIREGNLADLLASEIDLWQSDVSKCFKKRNSTLQFQLTEDGLPIEILLENNGTYPILPNNAQHVNCQDDYNKYGVCNNWWYDASATTAYALYKLDSMHENYYDLMNSMFDSG